MATTIFSVSMTECSLNASNNMRPLFLVVQGVIPIIQYTSGPLAAWTGSFGMLAGLLAGCLLEKSLRLSYVYDDGAWTQSTGTAHEEKLQHISTIATYSASTDESVYQDPVVL